MSRDYKAPAEAAPPDWRGLCEEACELWDADCDMDGVIDKMRAALAQPEPEVVGPTDKELLELMSETMRDEFSYAAKSCSDVTGGQVKPKIFRVCLNTAALEYAHAVLARWGRPAPVPAEGEVGELVAWLREEALEPNEVWEDSKNPPAFLTRAAELEGATRDPLEPNDLSHLSDEEFQALAPQGYHGL